MEWSHVGQYRISGRGKWEADMIIFNCIHETDIERTDFKAEIDETVKSKEITIST